jgi:hypothetical protein
MDHHSGAFFIRIFRFAACGKRVQTMWKAGQKQGRGASAIFRTFYRFFNNQRGNLWKPVDC